MKVESGKWKVESRAPSPEGVWGWVRNAIRSLQLIVTFPAQNCDKTRAKSPKLSQNLSSPPACLTKCIPHFIGKWAGRPAESVLDLPTAGRSVSVGDPQLKSKQVLWVPARSTPACQNIFHTSMASERAGRNDKFI